MTFSRRTSWDTTESDFAAAIRRARHQPGPELLDLTVSNPTACGFAQDPAAILAPLADEAALHYDPDPRGMRSAREAVARYYADHARSLPDKPALEVDPDAILLTTSTSEAYSFLFRLLCDPGDEILVAQPSYPLFDFLADLDDIRLTPYPLFYDFGWWIDFAALERRLTPRTRAVLVVHPNNPTGHWTHPSERQRLEDLCAARSLALIVDEVFLDYSIPAQIEDPPAPGASFAVGPHPALTFVLSGMSKVAALPQMKASWLVTFGPADLRAEALGRLEVIADTFLSMNAPVQHALPTWLASRHAMQQQIRTRTAANLNLLRTLSAASQSGPNSLELLHTEAGWAAVLRLRNLFSESEGAPSLSRRLLDEARVLVHPGSFYALADPRTFVLSLLTPTETLRAGVSRILSL